MRPQRFLRVDGADRDERRPGAERQPGRAAHVRAVAAGLRRPLREDPKESSLLEQPDAVTERVRVAPSALDRKRPEPGHQAADDRIPPQLGLGHVVNRTGRRHAEEERVGQRLVIGGEDGRAGRRDVLAALDLDPVDAAQQLPDPDRVEDGVEVHARFNTSCASWSARVAKAASQKAR